MNTPRRRTVQDNGRTMKGKTANGKPPAGGATAGMEPAKMKAIGAQMTEMGARMRNKGQAVNGEGPASMSYPPHQASERACDTCGDRGHRPARGHA